MLVDGITIAGNIIIDTNKQIKIYPKEGNLSYINHSYQTFGGAVPNTSITLRAIDNDLDIRAMGSIGDDEEGRSVISYFSSNNIDYSGVEIVKGVRTANVDVYFNTENAKRTFFINKGADIHFGKKLPTCFTKHLHLGYMLLLPYLDEIVEGSRTRLSYWLATLSSQGIMISCDMVSEESDRYNEVIASSLPYIDYLIINEIEASGIAQTSIYKDNCLQLDKLIHCAKVIKDLGVKQYVVIHSPMVSIIYDGKEIYQLNSLNIPYNHIKSSVGAGDAFCAGTLYGIIKKKHPLEILQIASCVAGDVLLSESPKPTRNGIKTFLEIENIYGRRKNIC